MSARTPTLLVLATSIAACGGGWPDLDPMSGDGTLDPRLGTEIDRSTGDFRVASIFEDTGVFVLYEEDAVGWQAQWVDADTHEAKKLPTPPLMPREQFMLGRAIAPEQAILGIVRDKVTTFLVLDEGAKTWREVEGPSPTMVSVIGADAMSQLVLHDGRIYAVIDGRIFAQTATGAWTEPATSRNRFILGGFDADRQWVVTQPPNLSLRAFPIDVNGVAGAPVLGMDIALPETSALNGNADKFQVIANFRAYVVTPTAITRSAELHIVGEAFSAPGSPSTIVATLDGRGGAHRMVDGVIGEMLLPPFASEFDGEQLDYLAVRASPTTEQMALVLGTAADGYAVLSVRIVDLPYGGNPLEN